MTLSQLDLISVHREKKSQQSLWKYEVGAPLTPLTLLVCVGGGARVCSPTLGTIPKKVWLKSIFTESKSLKYFDDSSLFIVENLLFICYYRSDPEVWPIFWCHAT